MLQMQVSESGKGEKHNGEGRKGTDRNGEDMDVRQNLSEWNLQIQSSSQEFYVTFILLQHSVQAYVVSVSPQ